MEYYYIFAIVLIFLVAGIISGCGTIVKTNYAAVNYKDATVYYYLPESLVKIKATAKVAVYYTEDDKHLTGSSRIIEQSFIPTTEMIADTKDLLSLNYRPDVMSSDEIKYGVNTKGLLETVSITADDRTAAIIAQLAEAPKAILTGGASVQKAGNIIVKIKEYTADFVVKATDITSTVRTIPWQIIVPNELGIDEYVAIKGDFDLSTTVAVVASNGVNAIVNSTNTTDTEVKGILTRPMKSLPLVIAASGAVLGQALPVYITVADNSKLIRIPVTRTAFAKKVNKITIQDGIVLSNEITKPSSVEGFVSIPVNIAKAIVSIPGQLVTFRYDNTKRLSDLETAKLTYEKSLVESQKYALGKGQELENVKLELQKTTLKNDTELQKTKLDLEKTLLQSQKDQLTAQKELDTLKAEIEKLKHPTTP